MIEWLVTLGVLSQAYRGATFALEGVEEGTGLPVATAWKALCSRAIREVRSYADDVGRLGGKVLEGSADVTTRILTTFDPSLLPAAAQPTGPSDLHAQLDDAEANAKEAEGLAKDAEDKAVTLADDDRAQVSAVATAMRRYATLARKLSASARQKLKSDLDKGFDEAKALADWALATSTAAKNPPADATTALASDMPSDVKSAVSRTIDQMTRSAEPDYASLMQALVACATAKAGDVNGPEHAHAHEGAACGGPGSCGCEDCKDADPNDLKAQMAWVERESQKKRSPVEGPSVAGDGFAELEAWAAKEGESSERRGGERLHFDKPDKRFI